MEENPKNILTQLLSADDWNLEACHRFGVVAQRLLSQRQFYQRGFHRAAIDGFVREWRQAGHDRVTRKFVEDCLDIARIFSEAEVTQMNWLRHSHWLEVAHIRSDERRRELMLQAETGRRSCRQLRVLAKASQAAYYCRLSPEFAEAHAVLGQIKSSVGWTASRLEDVYLPAEFINADSELRTARRKAIRGCVEQLDEVFTKLADLQTEIRTGHAVTADVTAA
ncbi:MAG: hypothetical protein QM775_09465 [Pirellulales bacterium]